MKNIAVIGIGALGKRHLQSLNELKKEYNLYGVEVNKDILPELQSEFSEAEIYDSIDKLPRDISFCVIATSSNVRRRVFDELMNHASVENLLFEKVLFQKTEDYKYVSNMLKERKCNAWVNCARREWSSYKKLKEVLKDEKIYSYSVTGGEWGLCCNGIHMIDLLQYLTGEEEFSLERSFFQQGIYESKRSGFKEIYGTIAGSTENGTLFQISCTKGSDTPSLVVINTDNMNIVIDEGNKILVSKRKNDWVWESEGFPVEYQSQMTGRIARDIIENGDCYLPKYDFSMKTHIRYIDMWLDEFRRQGMEGDICPIT